ncbi:MAG: hypothetical protein CL810_14595 [Cobetia sp.]|jgi:rSAM/selenodomain-associated transferase 1|uniref:TIGR04282 family arsenosugar biosynthesis glycosyltransferase n=1 Tax=Cobetia TaxID=204286 RepID=UPI000C473390|nr:MULTISPECIES: TIGR04282 family arsenosugar biosynthesis glycosyltransferase [Cobetia]MBF07910.1 hypothetical protein [Cobetia sp.]MBK10761.1 hypothetical protein [Cobetia sp.]MDH2296953.1 TIGR04282 family arsenosugar biosynthesis glycosyltransferase [Cobetia sp. 29-18-1]UBU47971.1 TIGR04282 family arsenosugar biosynthesis glycosyltransferase [Cobetia amphilecti]HAR09023.1 glycosyltransferase [Cobetia sp.]|tara:strand:+ start:16226 stop:16951 length:726 start_codon:yes stop_codon:yes gene_type:complete
MRDAVLPTLPTADAASEVRPTLIIFGRLPIAGHCKTRLIPALGPEGAARLYARMLSHIVDHACAARLGKVVVMLTPSAEPSSQAPEQAALRAALEARLRSVVDATADLTFEAQPQGELGERMSRAMARHLPEGPVLLMGSDLPALDSQRLREAAHRLRTHDAVLQPTDDGGYGLIGLKAPCPQAFLLPHWSHAHVCRDTLALLARAGRTAACLPTSWDVDEPRDLARLSRHLPALMADLAA